MRDKTTDLFLILTSEWYHMIEFLIKKEEYRDLTEYWLKRLTSHDWKTVTFQLGYSKKNRMTFEIKKIDIGEGKLEWGTDQKKFIIKLGERLK
jgi:hypothetical protein